MISITPIFRAILTLMLVLAIAPSTWGQSVVLEEAPFEEFVSHFPLREMPFEVRAGEMELDSFPLLPPDSRLHNYGECFDYRALGRVMLNDDYVYLLTYHWCDSLSPTPFYNMLIFSPDGELRSTKPISTITYFSKSWTIFKGGGIIECHSQPKARKHPRQHAYDFSTQGLGKMIYCSDGKCTVR